MQNNKRILVLVAVALALTLAHDTAAAASWTVTLDSRVNDFGNNPVVRRLPPGFYRVIPKGAIITWPQPAGCDANGENCVRGWEAAYEYESTSIKPTLVWNGRRYLTPEHAAVYGLQSTFFLAAPEDVRFGINDCGFGCLADNAPATMELLIESVTPKRLFTIGARDKSDAEFQPLPYNLDFYPGAQGSRNFPRELSTWFPSVYSHFSLTVSEADRGLMLRLEPATTNGTGRVRVAIDVWMGYLWREAGSAEVNPAAAGVIEIPAAYLKSGWNSIRLRWVNSDGTASALTWDQIVVETAPTEDIFAFGVGNSSAAEFAALDTTKLEIDVHRDPVSRVAREISWLTPYFDVFGAPDLAGKEATLWVDSLWTDGATVRIAADFWNGTAWTNIGAANVNSQTPGAIRVSGDTLRYGLNELRLRVADGSEGSASVHDRLALTTRMMITPPSKCAPAAPTLRSVVDATTTDYLGTPNRHSFGRHESVNVVIPFVNRTQQVRTLFFDAAGRLIDEAVAVMPGNDGDLTVGLTPAASSSTAVVGTWYTVNCVETAGGAVTESIASAAFQVF